MDWPQIERLYQRLPELERQISKFGERFPLHLLPRRLFPDVKEGGDCILAVNQDLEALSSENSKAMWAYLSDRISQKIHILVHICKTQQQQDLEPALDKMCTHIQWLEQRKITHTNLTKQRIAIAHALETMRAREDLPAIARLQKELHSIDLQLAAM